MGKHESMSPTRVLSILAAVLAIAACGEQAAPSPDRPAQSAEEIARQTEELAREVGETGRNVAEDPQGRQEAIRELERQERRARELARRAREELPQQDAAREGLVEANERTAQAASGLQEFARSDRNRDALRGAREDLSRSQDRAAEAIDRLSGQLSPEARRRLDDLRERVPEIPQNLPSR